MTGIAVHASGISVHAPGIGPRELLIPAFTFTGMAVHVRPEYPASIELGSLGHGNTFFLCRSRLASLCHRGGASGGLAGA